VLVFIVEKVQCELEDFAVAAKDLEVEEVDQVVVIKEI